MLYFRQAKNDKISAAANLCFIEPWLQGMDYQGVCYWKIIENVFKRNENFSFLHNAHKMEKRYYQYSPYLLKDVLSDLCQTVIVW